MSLDMEKYIKVRKAQAEGVRTVEELKEKLENYFKFEIANYIVSDILECETYNHVCLMTNLAIANNRISLENSTTLKSGLKKLFKINNMFDKFDKSNCII